MLLEFPAPILQHILLFCDAEDLFHISLACSALESAAKTTATKILTIIISKYYHGHTLPWMEGKTALANIFELTAPSIIVCRGFITFSLNIRKNTWKRCHDTRRDRGYFALVYYSGEVYAIGTYSVVGKIYVYMHILALQLTFILTFSIVTLFFCLFCYGLQRLELSSAIILSLITGQR